MDQQNEESEEHKESLTEKRIAEAEKEEGDAKRRAWEDSVRGEAVSSILTEEERKRIRESEEASNE